jgi:hypothetical protein
VRHFTGGVTVHRLSSDVLEQQFGPTSVEILHQDARTRVICTKVISSGQILELSRVEFIQSGADMFPDVHAAVVAGQSMGKAFRAHGIAFIRQAEAVYRHILPDGFNRRFGSKGEATIVVVDVFAGDSRTPYAHILETYSPVVAWPAPGTVATHEQLAPTRSFAALLNTL